MTDAQRGARAGSASAADEGAEQAALARIAARLKAQLASPTADSLVEVAAAHIELRALPAGFVTAQRIESLRDVAQFFYVSGYTMLALEPAANAVRFARQQPDRRLLRKALTSHGVLLADSGNLPAAIECYAEALDLVLALGEDAAEPIVWNGIGAALLYGGQYADSIGCFERVIELAGGGEGLSAALRRAAFGNIALASLYAEDFARGLRAAKASVEGGGEPASANELLNRVLAEANYARLLLEVDNLERARERCELAKRYAAKSCSQKAEHSAEIAEGLYEVHAGLVDVGISRLQRALDLARIMKSSLRDALIALVKAYDIAGKPQLALMHLRELLHHTRRSQTERALQHHRLHMEQLAQAGQRVEDAAQAALARDEPLGRAGRERIQAQLALLHRQAVVAELSEDPSGEHVYRVGKLAALLAAEYGCDDDTCFLIEMGARLHDVGKLGIPIAILARRGRINPDQKSLVRTHASIGAELLSQSGLPRMHHAVDIARHHHEWWDGSGYPDGIAGKAIPEAARITALADVFDVLTHARPYKQPWPVARALQEIQRLKGTQFDPELADLLVALVRRLQREVGDLDEYLGAGARESPFIQARRKIAEALRQAGSPRPPTLS